MTVSKREPGGVDKKAEKRIDPSDGKAYTHEEMTKFYSKSYGTSKSETMLYWRDCKPESSGAKAKAKAEPKSKAKAKSNREESGLVKAKAAPPKSQAKARPSSDEKVAPSTALEISAERRIDPVDGKSYVFSDLKTFYSSKFSKKEIIAYWMKCKIKPQTKPKPKGTIRLSASEEVFPVFWDEAAMASELIEWSDISMPVEMFPDAALAYADDNWLNDSMLMDIPQEFIVELQEPMLESVSMAGQALICCLEGCIRSPWNGRSGQPCCRTCTQSDGYEHGSACNKRFIEEFRGMIPAEVQSLSVVGIWQSGEDFRPWLERAVEFLHIKVEAACDGDEFAMEGTRLVSISAETVEAVGLSLVDADFLDCSGGVYSHRDSGLAVKILAVEIAILTIDGIDGEDLLDWAAIQIEADVNKFGVQLLNFVQAQRSVDLPGFLLNGMDDADTTDSQPLSSPKSSQKGTETCFLSSPSPESLAVKRDRQLHVYTWGKSVQKAPPPESEFNFNAGVLNCRGSANLWTKMVSPKKSRTLS